MIFSLDRPVGVIVLTNSDAGFSDVVGLDLFKQMMRIPHPKLQYPVVVDSGELEKYVGKYQLTQDVVGLRPFSWMN
jgi:hypothetical protein